MNFNLFPDEWYVVRYSLTMQDSSSEWQLPVSHVIMSVNNQYAYSYSVPIQSLFFPFSETIALTAILYPYGHCFSLSVQYSINYMRYSTIYYKIDFMLADFAQV